MPQYEIKRDAESIWFAVQTAAAAVSGWALLSQTNMDASVVVVVAGAVGSVARPVLGYLLHFLPRKS